MKKLLLIFTAVIFVSSCAEFERLAEGGSLPAESWWSCYPASNNDTKPGTGFIEVVTEKYICKVHHYLESKKELGIYEGQVKARVLSDGGLIPYGGLSVVREKDIHKYFDPHGNGYFKRLDTDEGDEKEGQKYYIEGYFKNGLFIRGKFINESSAEKVQFEGSYKQPITSYDNPSLHTYSWMDQPVYDTGTYTRESLTEGKLTKYFHAGVTYANLEDYKIQEAAEQKRTAEERKRQAIIAENNRKQDAIDAEQRKQELLTQLNERCIGFGFTGESNIAACVQREAFNDRQLAQQRYEFQTQLLKQAKEAQKTTKALEAQLARSKAAEEIALIQSLVNQGMWVQEMMKN